MLWQCRMIPAPGDGPGQTPWKQLRVGDMWSAPYLLEHPEGHIFRPAPNYYREHKHRPPVVVRLPGVVDFCVDGSAWRDGVPYGDGWMVRGEPPLLTVQPSINVHGCWHGYLIDGQIGKDVEGRAYNEDGYLVTKP
jgi:hypothetical protein